MQEFFANYLALLEKDYPEGTIIANIKNKNQVSVSVVIVDILDRTLNRMLFGPDYKALVVTPELEHRMFIESIQRH